jgi:hypothetical protein
MTRILRRVWIAAFSLLPVWAWSAAANPPPEMEPFFTAIERTAGEKIARRIFSGWQPEDTRNFFWALPGGFHAAVRSRAQIENAHLIRTFLPDFWTVVGNTLAAKMARERHAKPGDRVIAEAVFRPWNAGFVPPPDGLLYRVENGRLIIRRVLEAKLGGAPYSRDQMHRLMRRLQAGGVLLDVEGDLLLFDAERIFLEVAETRIRLRFITLDLFEQAVVLVRSQAAPPVAFPGEILHIPLNESKTGEVVRAVVTQLLRGKISKHPVYWFGNLLVERPLQELRDWIAQHRAWPHSRNRDDWERFLNQIWLDLGNQSHVFTYHLTDRERRALMEGDAMPAKHPLARYLRDKGPSPDTISSAYFYLHRYAEGEIDRLVADLGPAWSFARAQLRSRAAPRRSNSNLRAPRARIRPSR